MSRETLLIIPASREGAICRVCEVTAVPSHWLLDSKLATVLLTPDH